MPPSQEQFSETTTMDDQPPRQSGVSGGIAKNSLVVPASILLGALIIGVSIIIGLSTQGGGSAAGGATGTTQAVNVKDVNIEGAPYIGKENAPVTLVYWSDYQCPYCKAFEVGGVPQINESIPEAMPEIIKTYVDTGKVKVVFKEFAFLGPDSVTAAEYAYAVWDLYPRQFYAWRVAMMEAQDEEHAGFGDATSIDMLIQNQFPQFDLVKIKQRIVTKKSAYTATMNSDKEEGQSFGINGTPGFITGTKLIGGDAPFATFKAAIDPQIQ